MDVCVQQRIFFLCQIEWCQYTLCIYKYNTTIWIRWLWIYDGWWLTGCLLFGCLLEGIVVWETVKESKFSRYNCTTDWIRLKIRRDEIEVNLIWWKNFVNNTILYQTSTHTHRHTIRYVTLYRRNIISFFRTA